MTVEGEGMIYRALPATAVHELLVGLLALQHLQVDKKLFFTSKTRIYKDKLSSALSRKGTQLPSCCFLLL